MKENDFQTITAWFQDRPALCRPLCGLCRFLPYLYPPAYLVYLVLVFRQGKGLPAALLGPAAVLLLTVLLRVLFPEPRPFDVFNFEPLIRHRSSPSMPSRHSACALAIALAISERYPAAGITLGALALLVGATRVFTGQHFPRDVLAGYALALVVELPILIFRL